MGTAMTVPERHTNQTTGSLPEGILATEFVANIYDRWSKNKPPSTDRPVDSLSVWESALAPETFQYAEVVPASTDQYDDKCAADDILDLGEAGYRVLKPIPVRIKRIGHLDLEASFREANIAMSGSDSQDAYEALVADILETFDVLTAEQTLGPDAAEQLRILSTYIVKT